MFKSISTLTNSPLLGTILLIIIAILSYGSWRSFKSQKYGFAISFIVLIGLLLKIYMSSDLFLHPWDERYHALVAKNLMGHPLKPTLFNTPLLEYDYKMWSYNHIWLHKQPLALWGIMSSLAVFGVNTIAVRIPSILLTTLGTIISYQFGKKLFNRKVALFSSIFYTTSGLILEIGSGRVATDHVDIFFLFFIQLSVYLAWEFAQRKSVLLNLLCGVCIGLAVLSKWLPALIVLPIWGAFVIHSKFTFKEFILHGLTLILPIIAIALPWQLHIHEQFPLEAAWESSFNTKHLFESIEVQEQPWYYHFTMLRINYGELIYLPIIWFFTVTIKKRSDWKYWGLLIWIAVPYIFFTIAKTKMQGYTLIAAPAVFLVLSLFIQYLIDNRMKFKYKWLSILGLILLIGLPLRFTIERLKPFARVETPQWQKDVLHLSKLLGDSDKVVVFNVNHPIELMFHSNCTAYNSGPTQSTIDDLHKKGYTIYINELVKQKGRRFRSISFPSLLIEE